MKDKKAAIELSVSTIVVIVLAMSMLILGTVLIRAIFTGATESVNILNEKVRGEITQLFAEKSSNVVVLLGADRTAKIKAGTGSFGIGIGATTSDGDPTDRTRLKYTLTIEQSLSGKDCVGEWGLDKTKKLILNPLDVPNDFDEFQGSDAYAVVSLDIPEGTRLCSQKVLIDVKDTVTGADSGSFFIFEVTQSGFFT